MARARKRRLTDAGIAGLEPRDREYTVWDTRVAGFGVRVRPSGHRGYVYYRTVKGRLRKHTLGPVVLRDVEEVRRECLAIEVGASCAESGGAGAGRGTVPRFGEFISGAWKAASYDRFKPSTRKGVDSVLRTQLLPVFAALPLERITRAAVHRWFDRYSRTAPGGANHALILLHQILNQAIARGLLASNPARGVKRNPRRKLTRFLSREEIRRLHRVLDGYSGGAASHRQQADIIRVLLLTGCRKGEVANLRWQEVDGDVLHLADGKTGPRRVYLNAQARRIIERQARGQSAFVFPSRRNPARPHCRELPLWYSIRKEARIEDVRLHDLRHTYASQALMRGVPLPVVARLLGHKQPRMTLRYAHVRDREIESAAERIGGVMMALMNAAPARSTSVTLQSPR